MTCCSRLRKIASVGGPGVNRVCCAILRKPVPPPPYFFQPETIAFFEYADINIPEDGTIYFNGTAYEITGAELWLAVDTFVTDLKTACSLTLGVNNLSTKFLYIYPRVGGTALRHTVNLVNPATFQGTFYGGWTHDGSGALPNGTNAYFDTNCQGGVIGPGDNVNGEDHCFGVELKTNSDGVMMEVFCNDGSRPFIHAYAKLGGNMVIADGAQANPNRSNAVATSAIHMAINRPSSASFKSVANGVVLGTHLDSSSNDFSALNILEACYAGSAQFSNRKRTVFHESTSFADAALLAVRNSISTMDTTLNR